ncbi:MAG: tryptophan-rich sensory protein [Lachnospiraceae bacterium]|nr:tryptophan-rich sensory protein [Lachnospiraceae bacterium]
MGKSKDSKGFNLFLAVCILLPTILGIASVFLAMGGFKNPISFTKDIFSSAFSGIGGLILLWWLTYPLMGLSFYIVVKEKEKRHAATLAIFILQLVFNFFWFPMLGEGWFLIAAIWLFVLTGLVAILVVFTWKIKKRAALLLLPYLVLCLLFLFFNGHIAAG